MHGLLRNDLGWTAWWPEELPGLPSVPHLCGHWRTGGNSQLSGVLRAEEAAGCRRVRAEQRSWGSEACPWCSPSPIHPSLWNLFLGLTILRAMSLFISARNPAGLQKWRFHPDAQTRSPGGTAPDSLNPFFSFSLPPLPTPCQHPFDDSSSTSSRFPPVHLPLRQWNRFWQPHFYPPSTALQVPTCLNSFQPRSPPGLCTCRSLCQASSSPVPPVQCQLSPRLQCLEAVLSVPSRWEIGPVWVPCGVSTGIPCCDRQVHCSGPVSSRGPGTQ